MTDNTHPQTPTENQSIAPYRLTKREYFAALAMQGIVSGILAAEPESSFSPGDVASKAIGLADSVLNALER